MAKEAIPSINALAALVERSAPAVQKWVKRDDWPFGAAPWPSSKLPAIVKWMADHLQEDRASEPAAAGAATGGDSSYMRARTVLTTAKAMREQLALKRDKEEVHNVAECEQKHSELISYTKLVLMSQVPASAVGEVRGLERRFGRPLADLEMAEVFRKKIEDAINTHLAKT